MLWQLRSGTRERTDVHDLEMHDRFADGGVCDEAPQRAASAREHKNTTYIHTTFKSNQHTQRSYSALKHILAPPSPLKLPRNLPIRPTPTRRIAQRSNSIINICTRRQPLYSHSPFPIFHLPPSNSTHLETPHPQASPPPTAPSSP